MRAFSAANSVTERRDDRQEAPFFFASRASSLSVGQRDFVVQRDRRD